MTEVIFSDNQQDRRQAETSLQAYRDKFKCPMCNTTHRNHHRHKEHVKRCFE